MNTFISELSKFNRKERFFLVGYALGNKDFTLSNEFRISIEVCLHQLKVPIPNNAFVAMDYHIDWIFASIFLTRAEKNSNIYPLDKSLIKATQEDIDLIIAFNDERNNNLTHLVMCECKAETGWTNKQLISKAIRLGEIFGEDGRKYQDIVIPYFLLLSPRQTRKLKTDSVPTFMKFNGNIPWMKLSVPDDLHKVTRCDSLGKDCITGDYWKVEKT